MNIAGSELLWVCESENEGHKFMPKKVLSHRQLADDVVHRKEAVYALGVAIQCILYALVIYSESKYGLCVYM